MKELRTKKEYELEYEGRRDDQEKGRGPDKKPRKKKNPFYISDSIQRIADKSTFFKPRTHRKTKRKWSL